jgi:hypothetical protein
MTTLMALLSELHAPVVMQGRNILFPDNCAIHMQDT